MKQVSVAGQTVLFGNSKAMSGVPDGSAALAITSPPYWNLKNYGDADGSIGHTSYEEYLEDLNQVWDECFRKTRDNGVLVVNVNARRHQKRYYPLQIDIASRIRGWTLWDMNTWYVPNALPQPNAYMERLLDNKVEYLLVFTKNGRSDYHFSKPRVPQKYITADPRAEKKNKAGRCLGNVLRIPAYRPPNVREMNYHIAAFPEELVAFFMQCYTQPGDVVLDPFLGSGTTLKVARVMGRIGYGCEIEEKFEATIRAKIAEEWATPDWRDIDLLHSATMTTGALKPRKVQFSRTGEAPDQGSLLAAAEDE